ncbi:MAG: putative DNA mismatch repair protein MutS-like protein [Harvfovirus sp.]|uniref:Putative DNA mismatch repair protein MutS-like protein n=1 Tax=Harvfovirus sp. TaxID=2487768 RepID=A0A3G5A409_9VIRU|nr:MAG: putative DNA mismatch repair protein MutS-like protein [Harvfovirus sp.]
MNQIQYFANSTQIRLADGSCKSVEEITTADSVLGLDGLAKKIITVEQGNGKMFNINPVLGNNFAINDKHILVLKFTSAELINWKPARKYYSVQYLQDMKIRSKCFSYGKYPPPLTEERKAALLKQAQEFLLNKSKEPGYNRIGDVISITVENFLKLPNNIIRILYSFKQSIEYLEKPISIDPYMLGLWLGDGTSAEPAITNIDEEITDYIYKFADDRKLRVSIRKKYLYDDDGMKYDSEVNTYYIAGNPKNTFRDALKNYNLLNNKHIPLDYLLNTRAIRLQVLAGLIDTDGYLKDNCYEIVQKSDKIANGLIDLSRSLGFKTAHSKVNKTCVKKNGERVTGIYNRVAISGDRLTDIPVLLPRKKATPCGKKVNFLITQFKITETEKCDYTGFKIEGDGKFLGVDFTVLHA